MRCYPDGGISDSIPIRRAIADGFDKNVLVLTQTPGYQKQPNKALPLIRVRYRKCPKLFEAVQRRHIQYNETPASIREQEKAGKLFVLRPDTRPEAGRVEKDPDKLKHLHSFDRAVACRKQERLLEFLK